MINLLGAATSMVDAVGKTQGFGYGGANFQTHRTADSGGLALQTTYGMDNVGRKTRIISPLNLTTLMAYNAAGKVSSRTSAGGIVSNYEYDANARQTVRKIMDGGTPKYTWTTEFNADGKPTRTIAPGSLTTSFAYDLRQRLAVLRF